MTGNGKTVAHPSPDKPAYYLPVVPGFHEVDAAAVGEKPLVRDIVHSLVKELATQGYIASREVPATPPAQPVMKSMNRNAVTPTAFAPPPSLLLVFHWGTLPPILYGGRAACRHERHPDGGAERRPSPAELRISHRKTKA